MRRAISEESIGPYSSATGSPMQTLIIRTVRSSEGRTMAGVSPACRRRMASVAAARISSWITGGRPPLSWSPSPFPRVGR